LLKYLKRITIPDDFNSRTNEKYKKVIKTFFTSNKIHFLSTEEIASIVLNYIIITNLIEKFYYVHYKLNEEICLPYELDLSDIEFEVRGWKAEFKNEIRDLSEIIGLRYLQGLETLDLSNNLLEDLDELIYLKKLKNLILTNNRLKKIENIKHIQSLPNLRYLALEGNGLINKLKKVDFNPKINLRIVKTSYFQ
jgi:hypothetical protein